MYLLSALGGGLWIIPLGLFLASMYSFYRGLQQWKSGSAGYEGFPVKWTTDGKRVNFFTIGATVFGLIFLACAIGSFVWMQLEK